MYVLSDTMGYVHNFEIYTGAAEEYLPGEPNLGAAGNIVMRLCRILPSDKNYRLYYDNYYSGIPLAVYLYQKSVHILGTINQNRIPDRFFTSKRRDDGQKKKKKEKTKQRTSKFSLPDLKVMNDRERGSIMERVGEIKGTPLAFVAWKDNKVVSFLSTFVGSEPVSCIKRFDRKAKQKAEIQCPAVVKNYNVHMGGVDLLDANVARYKIRVKSR